MRIPVWAGSAIWALLSLTAICIGVIAVLLATVGWERLRASDVRRPSKSIVRGGGGVTAQQDYSTWSRVGIGAVGVLWIGVGFGCGRALYRLTKRHRATSPFQADAPPWKRDG